MVSHVKSFFPFGSSFKCLIKCLNGQGHCVWQSWKVLWQVFQGVVTLDEEVGSLRGVQKPLQVCYAPVHFSVTEVEVRVLNNYDLSNRISKTVTTSLFPSPFLRYLIDTFPCIRTRYSLSIKFILLTYLVKSSILTEDLKVILSF